MSKQKIVRTPTHASGGITEEERAKMAEISKKWIANAFRTDHIDPSKIIPAIKALYAAADLAEPDVIIVPSPRAMAREGLALELKLTGVKAELGDRYQGGNMWSGFPAYAEAMRDVIGLTGLGCWEKYQSWEDCAKYGGFRYLHENFCMVSDFPDTLKIDGRNRPHCTDGPSHHWRDGWSLWHINGVKVNEQIVMAPSTLTMDQIDAETNEDVRSIMIDRYGWGKYLEDSDARAIDERINDIDGTDEYLCDVHGRRRLICSCVSTGRIFSIEVPKEIPTCADAQKWMASGSKIAGRVVGSG